MAGLIRIGAMASGGGTNLQSIIDACEVGTIAGDVVVVVSDKQDVGALERARKHNIETVVIPVSKTGTSGWEEADRQQTSVFRERDIDLIVMTGYMRIIGPELLGAFKHRIMNIHPALLPAFPGVHVQWHAADYGVKIAGATVHFADEEFDTGPIIIQAAVPVHAGETGQELADRILKQEHRIYPQAVQWFAQGRLQIDGRIVRLLAREVGDDGLNIVSPAIDGDF